MHGKLLPSVCLAIALSTSGSRPAEAFDWLGRIELDADGLKSEDAQLRLKAVRDLQRYAIEWTQEHLLRALRDPDVTVRATAGRALAKHKVTSAVPIITKWLAEADSQSKQVAADILGELGASEAIQPLVRSLGDPDPVVRVHAIMALGKIGGDAVIVPLVARLEDDKSDVRLAAVGQLKELGDARAVIPLVGLFDDPSLDTRIAAIQAVGFLKDEAAVPALLRELQDGVKGIEIAAVTSLGNLRARRALPSLIAILADGNTASRGKVAYSLAQIASAHIDDPDAQRALQRLVEELANGRMRSAAREALLAAGVAAVPKLIESLNGTIAGDAPSAVQILLSLNDRRATPALIAELDRGRISQSIILQALTQLGDPRALLPVLALLEDKDPQVRLRAMKALGRIIGDNTEAADVIADHLDDTNLEIRTLAAEYLGTMRARSAVQPLKKLALKAKEPGLRASALAALGHIGDPSGAEVALQILREGPPDLRPVATDVLTALSSADATATLMQMAGQKNISWRALAIQALGATLRGKDQAQARTLLLRIATRGDSIDSLAAIEALATMRSLKSVPALRGLVNDGNPGQKQAAILALGAMRDSGSKDLLRNALRSSSDTISSAAAWALAETSDKGASAHLIKASRRRGIATAVNASAALVGLASAQDTPALRSLLHHRSPLVRVNAIMGLVKLRSPKQAKTLERLLLEDSSWLVRVAAIRGLSILGKSPEAIAKAAKEDYQSQVRSAAELAMQTPFVPSKRETWSVFRVVDPQANDKSVPRAAYFFVGSDGVATVRLSDERGRIVYEHFPAGDYVQGPLAEVTRY